jgi:hypothetical protein
MSNPHYAPEDVIARSMNAAKIGAGMRERVPEATEAEVRTATRALARVQWGTTDVKAAPLFWADSVLINWRLAGPDEAIF